MKCPECASPREVVIRSADAMFAPGNMHPAGLFAWVLRCWECGKNESGYTTLGMRPVVREDAELLYTLLGERTPEQSISHVKIPTFEQHVSFLCSSPYAHWYVLFLGPLLVGSIYLSYQREIGVFVFRAYHGRGIGSAAICLLMKKHPGKFLANINPHNEASIRTFEALGFVHIQNTYKGPTGNPYERE